MVLLGEKFPNFVAASTQGTIDFYEWLGNAWCVLFSHPYDFTPICTTELARAAELTSDFTRLGVKLIGLSCDTVATHVEWIKDIRHYADMNDQEVFPYPIIEDESRQLVTKLGMLDSSEIDSDQQPLPARAVFIVDPKKIMRLSILYPVTVGRNFDEIVRVMKSLQLYDKYSLGTPADWKNGEDCIIHPLVPQEEAEELYGDKMKVVNLPSGKPYLRIVPQPEHGNL